MNVCLEIPRITVHQVSTGAAAIVWASPTADIPATLVTLTSSDHGVPATAVGTLLGVEVGYAISPGIRADVQANIQSVLSNGSTSYPYTDIIRVKQYFDPAASVGAAMGQCWVSFPSSAKQIRYRLISTTTAADKHLIIQLHGYWE